MSNTTSFDEAVQQNLDIWVAGCGGSETPFVSRSGCRMLWCYNPAQHRHAYIDLGSDMELTNEEAQANMRMV